MEPISFDSSAGSAAASTSSARTVIVGFGNPYCGDDGVGPAAARLVYASLGPRPLVDLLELSSSALELVERLAGYDVAVIIDALVDGNDPVGTLKPLELKIGDRREVPALGFHTAGLGSALALARAVGMKVPATVKLYGIVIREPRVFRELLSEELERQLPEIARVIAGAEFHQPATEPEAPDA